MTMHIIMYFLLYALLISAFVFVYLLDRVSIFLRRGRLKKDAELKLAVERIINGEVKVINKKIVKKKA